MVQETTFLSGQTGSDSALRMDSWALANKRADDYLKLHRLTTAERENILENVARKLTRTPPCSEQELIQRFISTVCAELASAQHLVIEEEVAEFDDMKDTKSDTRAKTGPRFERSSIRVAPLQAINLGLLRSRQRHMHH